VLLEVKILSRWRLTRISRCFIKHWSLNNHDT